MRPWLAPVAALLVACGGHDEETSSSAAGGGGAAGECPPGERAVEGRACVPAGVQDSGCRAGEVTLADGGCRPAGIPPEACAIGFEPDDDGCVPILPSEPCADGEMAVPGDTQCRAVADCPPGQWGDIPVESNTQYVDMAYPGNDSDGSALKPWTSIQSAIAAADTSAIVAIAAGTYVEQILIAKPVRLWGVCPALVEIDGAGEYTVGVGGDGGGSELRDLAITGSARGLLVLVSDVIADRLRIHDTGLYGVNVQVYERPGGLTLSRSLVERAARLGIFTPDGSIVLDGSVVRDTQPNPGDQSDGIGILAEEREVPARFEMRSSVVSGNHHYGIEVVGGELRIEGSVVMDNQPLASDMNWGIGISALLGPTRRASLELRSSFVARNHTAGVSVAGSDALIESTVIEETQPNPAGINGRGLHLTTQPGGSSTIAAVRDSVVRGNHGTGIFVDSSEATIEGMVVRDQQGRGIEVNVHDVPSRLTLKSSTISNNVEVGVIVGGSQAIIEGLRVTNTQPEPVSGERGFGIGVQSLIERAQVTIEASMIEGSHDLGIAATGSDIVIGSTAVRDTKAIPTAESGVCVYAQWEYQTARETSLAMRDSLVESCQLAGVFLVNTTGTIEHTAIRDIASFPGTGSFGDAFALSTGFDFAPVASATLARSRIESAARAGVASFSGDIALDGVALDCNIIDLVAEAWSDLQPPHAPSFVDAGNNRCGCGSETWACKAISSGLAAPEPLNPSLAPPD